MKKYISIALLALLTISFSSCTKEADVAGIEAKLPTLQLSSLGYQQTGPFAVATTVLQLNFGATSTGISTGAFKVEILNGTAANSPVIKTVNFPSWNGKDDSVLITPGNVLNGPHSIAYTLQDTTYPNTSIYAGTILLKLSSLGLAATSTYSVRATALNSDGTKTSVITQLSFFKTI
jgi:hypothetical protein